VALESLRQSATPILFLVRLRLSRHVLTSNFSTNCLSENSRNGVPQIVSTALYPPAPPSFLHDYFLSQLPSAQRARKRQWSTRELEPLQYRQSSLAQASRWTFTHRQQHPLPPSPNHQQVYYKLFQSPAHSAMSTSAIYASNFLMPVPVYPRKTLIQTSRLP